MHRSARSLSETSKAPNTFGGEIPTVEQSHLTPQSPDMPQSGQLKMSIRSRAHQLALIDDRPQIGHQHVRSTGPRYAAGGPQRATSTSLSGIRVHKSSHLVCERRHHSHTHPAALRLLGTPPGFRRLRTSRQQDSDGTPWNVHDVACIFVAFPVWMCGC
eukprot:scaffold323242_cov33-Tisochrysis_lutea.AAC.2